MRCVRVLIAIVLLAVACAPATTESSSSTEPAEGPVDTTTTTAASTTTGPVPPSQTVVPGDPQDAPAVLMYGWDGVSRIEGGTMERLIEEPVSWAVDDGAGGVVFRTVAEEPGWAWLEAGVERPRQIELGETGWPHIVLVALVDGRPTALVSRTYDGMSQCELDDFMTEHILFDLRSGEETLVRCTDEGPDGGEAVSSAGGGLFSAVGWLAVGAGGTDTSLRFFDMEGREVDIEHNPFDESCAPCHLTARLSPDGSHLAYALWPTALWPPPEPADGDYMRARREWLLAAESVPTELVVLDLSSGTEVFRTDLEANASLAGFDGRALTVALEDGRRLFDIDTSTSFAVTPAFTGQRDFWTVILASLDHTVTSYDDAQARANRFSTDLNSPTGVLWSDGFITLNPGYWAVFTGHFDNQAGAASLCRSLDVSCYSRYVATAETIDAELGWDMLVLEPDGLGLVGFGAPEWEVLPLFERLMGSPPTGSYDEADWVEYLGWEEHGLYLGFSRQWYEGYEEAGSQFIGWQYTGGDLRTDMGVRVGMTLAELRSIYGDDVVVLGPDECGPAAYVIIDEMLVVLHPDIGVVQGMFAGMQTGC